MQPYNTKVALIQYQGHIESESANLEGSTGQCWLSGRALKHGDDSPWIPDAQTEGCAICRALSSIHRSGKCNSRVYQSKMQPGLYMLALSSCLCCPFLTYSNKNQVTILQPLTDSMARVILGERTRLGMTARPTTLQAFVTFGEG